MKQWLANIIAKYIILVMSIILGSSLYLGKLAHTHAAEFVLKNQAQIDLVKASHRVEIAIWEVQRSLEQNHSSRNQVLIALNNEQPHLLDLKSSLDQKIDQLESQLKALLETKEQLKLREAGIESAS